MRSEIEAAKSSEVRLFVSRLSADPAAGDVELVDHWDADPFAVGFTTARDRERLVYVSAWHQPTGTYHFECERQVGDSATPRVERSGVAGIDELIDIVLGCLGVNRD